MANHLSSEKRIRQEEARKTRNKYYGRTTRNALKTFRSKINKEEAAELLPNMASMLDKQAKRNNIHKNKAANLKSKLAKQLNGLK